MIKDIERNNDAKPSFLRSILGIALLVLILALTQFGSRKAQAFASMSDKTPNHSVVTGSSEIEILAISSTKHKKEEKAPEPMVLSERINPIESKVEEAQDFVYLDEIPLSEELQKFIYERSKEMDLDHAMVLAVMWRESRFDPTEVSVNTNGTTDTGIMQINDTNRDWLSRDHGINNLLDPVENIKAGTLILSELNRKHGLNNALIAYQYGEYGMDQKVKSGVTSTSGTLQLYAKQQEFKRLIDKASNIK